MWIEEIEEIFKGYLPYYILIILPIFIIVTPDTVSASHEFPVYRMQHYDLHGLPYGSRAAGVNLEARGLTTWSSSRHCVIVRLLDLTVDVFRNIRSKAGALIIMLPQNLSNLSSEEKQQLLLLEYKMLHEQEVPIPVYFTPWNKKMASIVDELSAANADTPDMKKSAMEALIVSVAANGYQISISASNVNPKTDVKIPTIQGHLSGYRADGKVPTIAIVAHYDSFGAAPDLAYGADSNGSGVVIMLELIRLLSGLYSDSRTRGKFNILFVLSGGGKINFQGSKKWLEDQLDSADGPLIQEISFVMCLDTLATSNTIYMHVSKPPKEGSAASMFYKSIKSSAENQPPTIVEGVHKKINLADDILAWEHERFSIRRLPAFSLSTVKNHKDAWKSTILDVKKAVDNKQLLRNAKVIVDALGNYLYNISEGNIFGRSWDISEEYIETWLNYLSGQPRSAQLLSSKDSLLLISLQENFNKYLSDVKVSYSVPDKRDPDYQFFGTTTGTMHVYSVKPAVFDLVLTFVISVYLGLVYLVISYFPSLYSLLYTLIARKKVKTN